MTAITNTLNQVEQAFAATLQKEIGVNVNVTCRTADALGWTVSGDDASAHRAANWLQEAGLLTIEDSVHDEELEETFVYLRRN